jgi:hypothetical protein
VANALSELVFSLRADVGTLKSDLGKARGEFRGFATGITGELGNVRTAFGDLKHPLKELASLTAGLGASFGGLKSDGVRAAREIASGFGTLGIVGLALSGVALLVTSVIDKYQEAGKAAKEAATKAAEAHAAETIKINEKKKALEDFIKAQDRSRDVAKKGAGNVVFEEAVSEQNQNIRQAGSKQRDAARELADAVSGGDPDAVKAAKLNYSARTQELNEFLKGLEVLQLEHGVEAQKKLTADRIEAMTGGAEDTAAAFEKSIADQKTLRDLAATDERDAALARLQDELALIDKTDGSKKQREDARIGARARYLDKLAALEATAIQNAHATDPTRKAENERKFGVGEALTGIGTDIGQVGLDKFSTSAANREQAFKESNAPTDEELDKFRALNSELEKAERHADDTKTKFEGLRSVAQDIGGGVTDLLVQGLNGGIKSMADFANAAKNLLIQLVAQLVKAVIVAAILSALLGAFGIAAPAGATVGGGTGIGAILSKSLGGFAGGGLIGGRGSGTSDSNVARVSAGEWIVPADDVKAWGVDFLASLSGGPMRGYAGGGLVGGSGGAGRGGFGNSTVIIQAFDAPAIERASGRVDGVNTQRVNSRQGALYQNTLRRSFARSG